MLGCGSESCPSYLVLHTFTKRIYPPPLRAVLCERCLSIFIFFSLWLLRYHLQPHRFVVLIATKARRRNLLWNVWGRKKYRRMSGRWIWSFPSVPHRSNKSVCELWNGSLAGCGGKMASDFKQRFFLTLRSRWSAQPPPFIRVNKEERGGVREEGGREIQRDRERDRTRER